MYCFILISDDYRDRSRRYSLPQNTGRSYGRNPPNYRESHGGNRSAWSGGSHWGQGGNSGGWNQQVFGGGGNSYGGQNWAGQGGQKWPGYGGYGQNWNYYGQYGQSNWNQVKNNGF